MKHHPLFSLSCAALATVLLVLGGCANSPSSANRQSMQQPAGTQKQASGIAVNSTAPNFTLPNQHGKPISLSDYRGKWVVLYFYPKDFTGGCTTEACSFRDGIAAFKNIGAVVLGVSPDTIKSHQKFAHAYNLPFTLLSDPDKKVMQRYGAINTITKNGKAIERVVRSTVLINPKGVIAYHWKHVKPKGHAEQVAAKLKTLKHQYQDDAS